MFSRAQLVAAVAVAGIYLAGALPQDPACARTYTVVSGDTCDAISVAQNVSTYQLATVNSNIIDPACDNLSVGEVLCLGLAGQDCSTVHVVASGDSCSSIAAAAGISFADLRTDNPNINEDCSNIYPGEVLCTATVTAAK